nr:MAG TPA: hypothetical protein [Bacteriophage sp.]
MVVIFLLFIIIELDPDWLQMNNYTYLYNP